MIKKMAVLDKEVPKNFGEVKGLINSVIISNPNDTEALVKIYSDDIIIWIGILDKTSTQRISLDVIFDDQIKGLSNSDNTNIILNIIQTI